MKYPLVEVFWYDATSEHSEITIDELPQLTLCRTVGRLLKRDEKVLWIASEVLKKAETQFRDTTAIPVGWIERVRRLKEE